MTLFNRSPYPLGSKRVAQRICLSLAVTIASASANPGGPRVSHGNVVFSGNGNHLRVTQSGGPAIIDWNSFSIRRNESTRFVQPGSSSAILNRVSGGSVSTINGSLQANGRIFLLNPNGILIGPQGHIDAAGFVASTLDISDEAFLRGGSLRFRGNSDASIINLGTIGASEGDVFLIASAVENHGSIRASNGTVGLAAGNDVLLRDSGEERIFVRGAGGAQKENGVLNTGTVEANIAELKSHNGNVYGMAVNNKGRVAATGITRKGGQIFLSAGGGRSRIRNTGTLRAKSTPTGNGGRITVKNEGAESRTSIAGTIDASASIEDGTGGEVLILGNTINIETGSLILADGGSGGGSIHIGRNAPGFNHATNISVGNGAVLSADALEQGDGGEVILLATDTLDFFGHASARGGGLSGDGGFVELSGKRKVNFAGFTRSADISAANGRGGRLLFDPIDVLISTDPGGPIASSPVNNQTQLNSADISNFLETMGDLEIRTDGGVGGSGEIRVAAGTQIEWNSASNLVMTPDGNFFMEMNSAIIANGDGSVSVISSNASIPTGSISLESNSTIQTNTGDITLRNQAGSSIGVSLDQAQIVTDSGAIAIEGFGGLGLIGAIGVHIQRSLIQSNTSDISIIGNGRGLTTNVASSWGTTLNRSDITSTDGNILIEGNGGLAPSLSHGIVADGGSVMTGSGNIRMRGQAGGNASGQENKGIFYITGDVATIQSGSGNIDIEGSGGAGTDENHGVDFTEVIVRTFSGNLNVTGNSSNSTTGDNNYGILLQEGAVLRTGNGNGNLQGTGGGTATASGIENTGIHLLNNSRIISTASGDLSLTGSGGFQGAGIFSNGTPQVRTANGDIQLNGTGREGQEGIHIDSGTFNAASGTLRYTGETDVATNNAIIHDSSIADLLVFESSGGHVSGNGRVDANIIRLVDNSAGAADFTFTIATGGEFHRIGKLESTTPIGNFTLDRIPNIRLGSIDSTGNIEINTANLFFIDSGGNSGSLDTDSISVEGSLSAANSIRFNTSNFTSTAAITTGQDVLIGANGGGLTMNVDETVTAGGQITFTGGANKDNTFGIGSTFSTPATIIGGNQTDTIDYRNFDSAITLAPSTGALQEIGAFSDVEQLVGTAFDDTLLGTGGRDQFRFTSSDSGVLNSVFGFQSFEVLNGGGGLDTITGSEQDDVFRITTRNGGNFNGAINFSSFEQIAGGAGNDQFTFVDQANVRFIDGGRGADRLTINDTNLKGPNIYTINENGVRRNPKYRFRRIENLNLLLGPGRDTVNTNSTSYFQRLDGGAAFDRLLTDPAQILEGDTLLVGTTRIKFSNFEFPRPRRLRITNRDLPRLQPGVEEFDEPERKGGRRKQKSILVENHFNDPDGQSLLANMGIVQGSNGAFGVAAAAINLGQGIVISIAEGEYLLHSPASLDGNFLSPSLGVIKNLHQSLTPDSNSELADALNYNGPSTLVMADGGYAIDMSGTPPLAANSILEGNLVVDAAIELISALQIPLSFPATEMDAATAIDQLPVQPAQVTRNALLEQLGAASLTEMEAALQE